MPNQASKNRYEPDGDGRRPRSKPAPNGKNAGGDELARPEDLRQVECAKAAIEQMAREVIRAGQSGTIGVEIPMKDGKLGALKRVKIVFQGS